MRESVIMITDMNDDDFFELYCKKADVVFSNGIGDLAFIKDKNFKYQYLSPLYKKNESQQGLIVTNKDTGLSEEQSAIWNIIRKQDEEIKQSREVREFLDIDIYKRIGLVRKRPIINPSTNNFVGIVGVIKPFSMPNFLSLIYKMHGIDFGLNNKEQSKRLKFKLTERQNMVLFLYVNKYSNTEISLIISLITNKMSVSRVNDHLENLKYIFQVNSKEQLIEKAISLDYHLFVPRKFLKFGSYPLNDELIIAW
jgi:DNA-binding CsgD family transcriptional regulator